MARAHGAAAQLGPPVGMLQRTCPVPAAATAASARSSYSAYSERHSSASSSHAGCRASHFGDTAAGMAQQPGDTQQCIVGVNYGAFVTLPAMDAAKQNYTALPGTFVGGVVAAAKLAVAERGEWLQAHQQYLVSQHQTIPMCMHLGTETAKVAACMRLR